MMGKHVFCVKEKASLALAKYFIFISSVLCGFTAHAQTEWDGAWITLGNPEELKSDKMVVLTGTIISKNTGEPIAGASLSVDQFKYFDYTDQQGRYYIELPSGSYRIMVRFVGMKTMYLKLRVATNSQYDISMEEGVTDLAEVVISSRPLDSNVKSSLSGVTKLNVLEVKALPSLMGEIDILKSLQLTPGVSSIGEGSSGFNVRGGRVDQNLVLLNDVPLFSTSHALGFVSAFNQDVINDFTLYKGNVPANLGGRAASVLEVTTRNGSLEKWGVQGGVGPVSSRLTLEGPIKTDKTSLLVAGRFSHADWVLRKVDDPDVNTSSVSFNDAFASLHHLFSPNSSLDITYYDSEDSFQFSDQFGYDWDNTVVNARWRSLSNRKASPLLSVAYGRFKSSFFDPSGIEASTITNTLEYFQLKETVNYTFNEKHSLTGGIEGIVYIPEPETIEGFEGNPAIVSREVEKNKGAEFAAFIGDDFQISPKLALSAGLRFSHYRHLGQDTVFSYLPNAPRRVSSIQDTTVFGSGETIDSFSGLEPRLSLRYNLTPDKSVKASYNRMRQNLHLISNTTTPTPVDLWQVGTGFLPPQIADNFSLGYFFNMKDNLWEASVEGFYKRMSNLVEYKNFPELFLNNHIETEVVTGRGRAYGGELYIRKLKGRWQGWASYTYAQSEVKVSSPFPEESINDGRWFPSNYNKPHTFNFVATRTTYKGGGYSLVFTYSSGRPVTAIESSFVADGTVVPVFSDRNQFTIPDYIRVDFSVTFGSVLRKVEDSLVFSIYNLLGRENAYSVFYQRPTANFFIPKAFQLSVLGSAFPSLTYNFKF